MGRKSINPNKSIYQERREELGLSREAASEFLRYISPERIEKIENEKSNPHPDEILLMAEGYGIPELCNHYCAKECAIGRKYVPEIKNKGLLGNIVEMHMSLKAIHEKQDRLLEIAKNEKIEKGEVQDFIYIQEELERISINIEALQLWVEQNLAQKTDAIDKIEFELYKERKNK